MNYSVGFRIAYSAVARLPPRLIEDRRSQKSSSGVSRQVGVPLTTRTPLITPARVRIRCPSTGRFQLLSSLGGTQAAPAAPAFPTVGQEWFRTKNQSTSWLAAVFWRGGDAK